MTTARRPAAAPAWLLFAAVAVLGLFYVKWQPYWGKAFTLAHTHAMGPSILTGTDGRAPAPSWGAALGYGLSYGLAIWKALVLALLLGSGVQALLPADWVARALGERRFGSTCRGGLLALPGMMCTCCAAPIVAGLRRRRASAGAATAFWLANPVLNPATLVFIGLVLGWRWAALRLVLGLPMVLGLGALADRLASPRESAAADAEAARLAPPEPAGPWWRRWAAVLLRMSVQLIPEYLLLVLLLGAARAWLFPVIGPAAGNSVPWILAFAAAGALFVIPTAGEAPIIKAMLALGVGAGPAGALLMTLAPVSLPSMAMLGRALPARVLLAVAAGVVLFGVAAGLLAATLRL